jgi:hypothetical protein
LTGQFSQLIRIGGININSRKIVKTLFLILFILSLCFNYYQHRQNNNFKLSIGSEYLIIVRNTVFDLEGPSTFWIEELKKDKGDLLLERHIGELQANAINFNKIGGYYQIIGVQLQHISNLYWDLSTAVKNKDNDKIIDLNSQIEEHKNFIIKILKEIDKNLGENQILWYRELSNPNSKTSNLFWNELKAFESNNKN